MDMPVRKRPPNPAGLEPYSRPQPWGMVPDMAINDALDGDDTLWAPVAPGIWSRPLHLNVSGGYYVHLLRVKRAGILQRHRHSGRFTPGSSEAAGTTSSTTGLPAKAAMCSSHRARPTRWSCPTIVRT